MNDAESALLTPPVNADDHAQGPGNAPVTLVEYGDFECPHCGRAYPIVKEVRRRLGDGLRLVFRHFPLTQSHPHAERAAEATEAAAAQGEFWAMHDELFTHQDALDDVHLVGYAAKLGLDTDRFTSDLENGTYADRVREDVRSGIWSGVNDTPTFFINGRRHDGPWELADLLAAVERVAVVK
jgi:protein-disulfide isomerase